MRKNCDRDNIYVASVVLIFLLLGMYNIFHHDMWRDEIQSWLIARDSISIFDLFRNLRYEAHPA
ncbi:MAG: hypothetical protein ACD_33C00018G0001, partial [uncultured bacterium]